MRMSLGSCFEVYEAPEPTTTLLPGDRQAKVIAVAAQKGGVGKTTTSVTLASAWARHYGKRVLLIDLDPQSNVNIALRAQVVAGGGALSDVLAEQKGLEVEDISTATLVSNLRVTPSDPSLRHTEDRMAGRIGKEMVLRKALEVTRTWYDLIVIDCPPHIGTLTVNALVAADHVLIPANPAALAMAGVAGLMRTVHEVRGQLNESLDVLGVVLTKVDGRNARSNAAVLELAKEAWGEMLLPVRIGVNDALNQAQLEGRDIYDLDSSSRGAEQYRELAGCVLERLEST